MQCFSIDTFLCQYDTIKKFSGDIDKYSSILKEVEDAIKDKGRSVSKTTQQRERKKVKMGKATFGFGGRRRRKKTVKRRKTKRTRKRKSYRRK